MIFHGRLPDRNYWCRRRPRYLIFSQFSIYCCQNAFASGALPRTPPGGFQLPQLANVGSHHCRGPHRIAGPRAPRPHDPPLIIRCKNLALYIRDCVSLCVSDETLKAVGPFYLVSMPGEVKDPTSLHWKCVTCRGLHNTTL